MHKYLSIWYGHANLFFQQISKMLLSPCQPSTCSHRTAAQGTCRNSRHRCSGPRPRGCFVEDQTAHKESPSPPAKLGKAGVRWSFNSIAPLRALRSGAGEINPPASDGDFCKGPAEHGQTGHRQTGFCLDIPCEKTITLAVVFAFIPALIWSSQSM